MSDTCTSWCPQLSPTFSASVFPDAALPLTTHSPDNRAQEQILFRCVGVPQNDKTGLQLTLDLLLKTSSFLIGASQLH